MPYDIRRNYRGKSGYSVVGPDGTVEELIQQEPQQQSNNVLCMPLSLG